MSQLSDQETQRTTLKATYKSDFLCPPSFAYLSIKYINNGSLSKIEIYLSVVHIPFETANTTSWCWWSKSISVPADSDLKELLKFTGTWTQFTQGDRGKDFSCIFILSSAWNYSKFPLLRNSILRNSGLIFSTNMLCYWKFSRLFSVKFLIWWYH